MAKTPAVIQFPQTAPPTPTVNIAVAKRAPRAEPEAVDTPALDLSGKPRVVFLIGRGGTGKTTAARWMIERAQAAGRPAALAALDPVNRTLTNYFDNVGEPASSDPATSARYLRNLVGFCMDKQHSAVIDLGGGDTTLASLLDGMPDLAAELDRAGMAAVALYTLAPRIDDLAPFLSLGFQPAATAFVCNMGLIDAGAGTAQFRPLLDQPAIRDAGARVVWMPRLDSDVVGQIETGRMSFETASRKLGPFAAAQVRQWLKSMDRAFEGVSSWLV